MSTINPVVPTNNASPQPSTTPPRSQELMELEAATEKMEELRKKALNPAPYELVTSTSYIKRKNRDISPLSPPPILQPPTPNSTEEETPSPSNKQQKTTGFTGKETPSSFNKQPPTPRKVKPSSRLHTLAPVSPYQKLQEDAKKGSCSINSKPVNVSYFASGSYMSVHTINADHQIVPSFPNNAVLLKIYNEEKSRFSDSNLLKYMCQSIENYSKADELGIPIATIFNIKTAVTDRFFLQEKVPNEIDITNSSHINQVRKLFLISLEKKVILDLIPSNLRVNDKGTVTLIDFVENESDGQELFIKHAVASWCKAYTQTCSYDKTKTREFLDQFTEGFDQYGYSPEWKDEILNQLAVEVQADLNKNS